MRELTAAQLTPPLPMEVPKTSRRLTKLERSLLIRLIDSALGFRAEPFATAELSALYSVRDKIVVKRRRRVKGIIYK